MKATVLYITAIFLISSCLDSRLVVKGIVDKKNGPASTQLSIASVSIENDQLVINGSNLSSVNSVRMTNLSGFNESFDIETVSENKVIANSFQNLSFIVGSIFDVLISDAQGASTFSVSFDLQDGQVTSSKIADMGASIGDVLYFDGTNWIPRALDGLTYEGTYDATGGDQTVTTPVSGHYYIITVSGGNDPDGTTNGNSYVVGDWSVYNGATNSWDRIVGSDGVTSVAGKTGVVTLDWADVSKTSSQLNDIANVNTTGINDGEILSWSAGGSQWIPAALPTDTNTNAATICSGSQVLLGSGSCSALPIDTNTNAATICSAGEYLDGNGSCVTALVNSNAGTICSTGQFLNGDGACQSIVVDTNTNAATLCSTGEYLDGSGSCVSIPVNTNAGTLCSAGEYLDGNGSCVTALVNSNAGTICSTGEFLNGDGACQSIVTDTNTNAATICTGSQVLLGSGSCSALTADTNTNAATLCSTGEYLDGSGSCVSIPVNSNAGTICSTGQFLNGDGGCQSIVTDTNTNAATICTGSQVLLGSGSCAALTTDTDTNTNAGTICADGEFLNGDGTCDIVVVDTNTNAGTICATGEFLNGDGTCQNILWSETGSDITYTAGRVGIGTTSPYEKFEVIGSDSTFSAKIENTSSTSARYPKIVVSNYDGAGLGGYPMFYGLKYRGDSSSPTPVQNGDILVEFTGAGSTNTSYGSASGASIILGANENFSTTAHSAYISFTTVNPGTTTSTEKLKIDADGEVGIGTSNPGYKLHVEGTVYATGAAGSLSDRRHKKNITPIENQFSRRGRSALDIILGLRAVTFDWIDPLDDGMEGIQLGFIAQEVEEVLPEAVMTQDNKEKTKTLVFNHFMPVIVKALQEQNLEIKKNRELFQTMSGTGKRNVASIEILKEEVSELRKENSDLKSRLDRMEALLENLARKE